MNAYASLDLRELPLWKTPLEAVEDLYQTALANFSWKVIVLNDDPTGVQTVHEVNVYTDWSYEHILEFFQSDENICFVLTNSRSFTSDRTKFVHLEISENICRAAMQTKREFVLISRGLRAARLLAPGDAGFGGNADGKWEKAV